MSRNGGGGNAEGGGEAPGGVLGVGFHQGSQLVLAEDRPGSPERLVLQAQVPGTELLKPPADRPPVDSAFSKDGGDVPAGRGCAVASLNSYKKSIRKSCEDMVLLTSVEKVNRSPVIEDG